MPVATAKVVLVPLRSTPSRLEWLMAGPPQISPARPTQALAAPVALELTGPRGGIWTRQIPNPACQLSQVEL